MAWDTTTVQPGAGDGRGTPGGPAQPLPIQATRHRAVGPHHSAASRSESPSAQLGFRASPWAPCGTTVRPGTSAEDNDTPYQGSGWRVERELLKAAGVGGAAPRWTLLDTMGSGSPRMANRLWAMPANRGEIADYLLVPSLTSSQTWATPAVTAGQADDQGRDRALRGRLRPGARGKASARADPGPAPTGR